MFCSLHVTSQDIKPKGKKIPVVRKDTLPKIKKDSTKLIKNDSLLLKKIDTVIKDTIKPKEVITDIITDFAKDYKFLDKKKKTVTLYNEARVKYTDIDLQAGIIIIDYLNNTIFAKGIKDSTGYKQRPIFKQGGQESEQDSMLYNFKTKKAIIYGIKTTQDPGVIVLGEKAKRVNDSTIFMRNIRFTTSDKENPDYYIGVNKAKVVPKKKIVAGFSNLVIADVPTPVFLPFAYFPLGQKRTSGFIIPSWSSSTSRGLFLQNGGYYFAINDYVDLELLGDVYSNGSWGLRTNSQYYVRYKFSGNLNLSFEKIIESTRGFDDFSEATNFNFRWSHRQDPKSNPTSNFSAQVNIGSSQYFRQSLNEFNNSNFLSNTFNSSISYQKTFVGTPFNLSLTATHSQNTNTELVSMTLPTLQVNMNRIYPFAGKGGIKKNPLQNIGLTYNLQGQYQINTTEEDFFTSKMFETARSGVQHRTDASTNITLLNYFTLSPSINYREVWNFQTANKTFDPTAQNSDGSFGAVVTDTIRGFRSFREYSTSLNLSTNIYGTFNFKRGRLKAIRHTIRPSVSFTYRPDFADRYNMQVAQSSDPTDLITYSPFGDGTSLYGTPSAGLSSSIGISINNVLEAKVAPKDPDSDEEDRKITILNNLNFQTAYNIAADSLRWSPVNMTAGTRLFKDKLAVNFNAVFDPYQVDDSGNRINKFNKGLLRMTSANVTANYSLSSKDFSGEADDTQNNNSGNGNQNTPDVLGRNIDPTNRFASTPSSSQNNRTEEKETELYRATIPWTLNLAYSAFYSNDGVTPGKIRTHSLMFGGDLELTPKWKVGFSSGYDIFNGGFSFTRLNFSRDLDSWRLNFNWVPFGVNQSYTFFIGVKSSVLSDLKYDKNRPPNRVLF
ncbi:putative LPS assembly protein LptD [Pseudotenacibaculum haliotis]|uniref:putative LPS assembly protein LptD n=1 Tax=Pseudotenacibaculum haliotis TaxID=1862138 RepID=UPI0036D3B50D